ncbi:MAG: hypothetical protein GEV28_12825 [Actinophytocola sp.]|uniref:hypothetical protein n=1 Tax=Actinophytocola sp. TaxID=1872138 RepID=UPI0013257585|nr:hypothetical protein [Actinophytocola sp.]MPZ81223.1 hypothetical protein [Actinophytocola sp.]
MSDSPASKRRFGWRVGVGVAVVGLASAGAIGIAAATSGQPSAEPAPPAEEHGGPPWSDGDWGGGHWGGGGPFGVFEAFGDMDIADISHAEVVLAKEGGGSQTVLVQKGAVTSVDGGSIAVKSADGYAKSYTVNAETKVNGAEKIDSVATDEQVVVVSKDGGDKPAATVVVDITDLGWK